MNNPINAVTAYQADPTGATDSTQALQNAINAGIAAGTNVYIPQGNYTISAPLVLGSTGTNGGTAGWSLYGDGCGQPGSGGTSISLSGAGLQSIFQVNDSAWYYCTIRDLYMRALTPGGATYGVLYNDTAFSSRIVRDVRVDGVSKAYAILQGSGGNGEFCVFERCRAQNVDTFFYSNSGQAYVQRFDNCAAGLNVGGTYFDLELPNGGGGLVVTNFNATGAQQNGISNSTLLKDAGSSSPITFIGGRVEHITKLVNNPGGSADNAKTVLFEGMELTADFDPTNANNAFTEAVTLIANSATVVFRGCTSEACTPTSTFPVYAAAGWGSVVFEDCIWEGFAQPPYIATDGYDEFQAIHFIRCRCDASNAPSRAVSFDREFVVNRTRVNAVENYAEAQWVASGMTGNLLASPLISTANGAAVSADTPWVDFGSTLTVNSSAGPNGGRSIQIPAGCGVYQDITALDLSTTANARDLNGTLLNTLAYRGKFSELGPAAATIALVDSVSGQVYDEFQFRAGGPTTAPVYVDLVACMKVGASSSFVRLKITNTDTGGRTLVIAPQWQFAEIPA